MTRSPLLWVTFLFIKVKGSLTQSEFYLDMVHLITLDVKNELHVVLRYAYFLFYK